MQSKKEQIEQFVIEQFNGGKELSEIVNKLRCDSRYRRWIDKNIGNMDDTRHYVEDLLCETALQ